MKASKKFLLLAEYAFFGGLIISAPITALFFSYSKVSASPQLKSIEPASELLLPIAEAQNFSEPNLTAQHALAIDVQSGGILFEKNAQVPVPPASLTKLVTALTSMNHYPSDQIFTVTNEWQAEGNRARLLANEQLTRDDVLKALLIFSGNDAAEVLATHFPGGRSGFITEMNQYAKSVGAVHSSFQNPSGLDEFEHFSTAYDLGLLFRQVIQSDTLLEMVKTQQTTISSVDGKFAHTLYSTNALLGRHPGMIAGKTGSTDLAGQCFVALVEIDGQQVITVVLNSQERFSDTAALIEWLEQRYEWQTIKYLSANTTQ